MAQTEPKKDSKQVVVELTMPLEEARRFIWQGTRAPHEPMGKLWDSKQLDRGDLGWAVDAGYDPQFCEAARTLLANSIGKPSSFHYGPEVIEGSRYLEDRERDNLIEFSVYFGLAFGIAIWFTVALLQTIFTWIIPQLNSGNILGVIIVIVFCIVGYTWIGWYLYKRIRSRFQDYWNFREGREGEDEIVDRLRTALDNRWTIFRNLHLPGHNDDLDIALVGPGGVWIVEAKSAKSTIRIEGKNWSMQTKKGWVPTRNNPSIDVTKNATRLNDFLKRQGINRWIEKAIALASPQPVTNFELSEVPVWLLPTIEDKVSCLSTRYPPTEAETKQIVTIFQELATKQIAKEDAQYKK